MYTSTEIYNIYYRLAEDKIYHLIAINGEPPRLDCIYKRSAILTLQDIDKKDIIDVEASKVCTKLKREYFNTTQIEDLKLVAYLETEEDYESEGPTGLIGGCAGGPVGVIDPTGDPGVKGPIGCIGVTGPVGPPGVYTHPSPDGVAYTTPNTITITKSNILHEICTQAIAMCSDSEVHCRCGGSWPCSLMGSAIILQTCRKCQATFSISKNPMQCPFCSCWSDDPTNYETK